MKILDLTHLIEEAMPVYPETEPPKLTPSNTFEQHGFRETLLTMGSHTGTHMDAPAHMLRDGKTLDQFPADKYVGTAYVLDCSDLAGKEIPKARLQLHASEIEAADFLLFYTGWEKYWGSEQYFSPFPVLSLEAAEYLAAFPLKGVGTDAISIDPMDTVDYPVHKILLGAGFVNTENLCNLASLVGKTFLYAALPLRFKNADGSPSWIDTDSIRQEQTISSFDMRLESSDFTVVSTMEFDTSKNTWRTAALVTRDKDGKVLHAEKKENPDDGWNKLIPGTYGKNLYRHYVETPLPPPDAKWKQLYKDNRGAAFSIDTNSLRYKNGYADFWLAVEAPNQEKDLSRIIYRIRMNMAYKKVMTLSATEYNAAGKIRLHAAAEGAKETIPNDSPVEKVFEYLKNEIDSGRL